MYHCGAPSHPPSNLVSTGPPRGVQQRLAAPTDHLQQLSSGLEAYSLAARASAAQLLAQPLGRAASECLSKMQEVCRRFDKKGCGWVSLSSFEFALTSAGIRLGDTAGERLQALVEALGDCVQLDPDVHPKGTLGPKVPVCSLQDSPSLIVYRSVYGA